jgi:predicted O-methyltransferase YrrM
MAIGWYLWRRGERSLRIPRPAGEVVAEYFILSGVARFLVEFIRINPRTIFGLSNAQAASLLSIVAGAVLLLVIKPRFKGEKQEHKVLRHIEEWGDVLQPEVHRPTPECPHPERWRMYDGMTAEYEVLQFLKSLVTTVKPRLVVETGTFSALSTIWIAEGLRENGFGKVITCESDPKVFEQARQRMEASGLMPWIECRNQSSLEMKIEGTIDIFFSDSGRDIREQEVRRFLPQISPNGLILMHDASSHLKTVRESALRMEAEGLLSVLLLPTPRGLVVAQKRAGRH